MEMDIVTINGVEYVRKDTIAADRQYRQLVEAITVEIKHQQAIAVELYEDFKSQGLTANSIEAEGYLRGVLTLQNHILDRIRWSKDDSTT
jgi:hypothetical protein